MWRGLLQKCSKQESDSQSQIKQRWVTNKTEFRTQEAKLLTSRGYHQMWLHQGCLCQKLSYRGSICAVGLNKSLCCIDLKGVIFSDLKCSGFEKCEINAYEHFSTEYRTRDVCSNQRGLGDMEILYSCYGMQKRTNFRRISKRRQRARSPRVITSTALPLKRVKQDDDTAWNYLNHCKTRTGPKPPEKTGDLRVNICQSRSLFESKLCFMF